MQFFRIWIFFKGYVIIRVDGANIERFINICVHKKVLLFDIERKANYVVLKILANRFKVIKPIAKKTGCSVKLLEKKGFSFFLRKYKKRKSFVIGCVSFLVIFMLLWSYIWEIELEGTSPLKKDDVVRYLEKNNIGVGSIKYFLDTKKIKDDFILNFKDISWVDVKVCGTKLIVNAISRKKIPKIIDKNLPCDIVAARDGIIEEVLVKNGVELVKPKDVVLKGDVLISGLIKNELLDINPKAVHAIGSVKARTWYYKVEEVNLMKIKKIYNGKISKRYGLELFNKELFKLKLGKEYNRYDKAHKTFSLRLFKDFVIPIKIRQEKRMYYDEKQDVLKMSDAKKQAYSKALNYILKSINKDSSVIKQQVDCFYDSGKIFVKVGVETLEDIGMEKIIE